MSLLIFSSLAVLAPACSDTRGHGSGALDLAGGDGPDPADHDGDGATPAQGDCDDNNPLVGPNSIELPGNGIDDNCNGMVDEPVTSCDTGTVGSKNAADLASAIGICNAHFILGTQMLGPSDDRARNVVAKFGSFANLEGASMALFSTGIAADKSSPDYVRPQVGTVLDQNNTAPNPDPSLPGIASCGSTQPVTVNDYSELAVSLRVPMNVASLSFQLQFFSAEYPEFVCTAFNDELLVELQSQKAGTTTNISFDSMMNPITVNNSFFTICQNDATKPQTQHCSQSIDLLQGTGYEDTLLGKPIGGSTGWLKTSAPVIPGDTITLHFIIFDEEDHIYDSAALLDNFAWSTTSIASPVTVQ